jgi:hypothetical protein
MKTFTRVLTLLAVLASVATAQPKNNPFEIIPGERIGAIKLGISEAEVRIALVGFHSGVRQHTYGVKELIFPYQDGEFDVLLQNDRVVQIAISDDKYSIDDGYSIKAPVAQFRAKFPGFQQSLFYFDTGNNVNQVQLHDNKKMGLAFYTQKSSEFAKSLARGMGVRNFNYPSYLIVHQKGRDAIAIKSGFRGQTQAPKGETKTVKPRAQTKPATKTTTPTQPPAKSAQPKPKPTSAPVNTKKLIDTYANEALTRNVAFLELATRLNTNLYTWTSERETSERYGRGAAGEDLTLKKQIISDIPRVSLLLERLSSIDPVPLPLKTADDYFATFAREYGSALSKMKYGMEINEWVLVKIAIKDAQNAFAYRRLANDEISRVTDAATKNKTYIGN